MSRSREDDAKRAQQLAEIIRDDFLGTGCVPDGIGYLTLYPSGTVEFWIDSEEEPPVRMLVTVRPAVQPIKIEKRHRK